MKVRLATRGSPLALWQAEAARRALSAAWSKLDVEVVTVQSSGDRVQDVSLASFGSVGIFTVEVDRAVLEGRADAAVHSLKDMTTKPPDGLRLAAVLARGPVEDVLVARRAPGVRERGLDALPAGARVATGSRRRAAMLLAVRPDLEVVEARGNVATRLAKLDAGESDATILARAGLERLGLAERITEVLDVERFVPAVGQGLVGLTCRADDDDTAARLRAIRDLEGWHEALAERTFLARLHGGCNVPAGGHARAVEGALSIFGRVLSLDGEELVEGRVTGPREEAAALGERLADDLIGRGAERLIEAARA